MSLTKISKRYYCGSLDCLSDLSPYMKATFEEGVEAARQKLEKDPKLDKVSIVKIVGIVRREKLPIIVERIVD